MHEMPLLENVLSIVIDAGRAGAASKIVSVTLRLGPFSDADEVWLNRYFEVLARGTSAEGAVLKIKRDLAPSLNGSEYYVESIEVSD